MRSLIRVCFGKVTALGAALATVAVLALPGCGGNDSVADVTGQFVDAPVAGLSYKCGASTTLGTTDANGYYTCKAGESVGFYVGDILLGSVASAQAVVTPLDLVGLNASPADTTVKNIVRFLLSISTTDANGNMVIDSNAATLAKGKKVDFKNIAPNDLDTMISTVKPNATVIDVAAAETHMRNSIYKLFAKNFAGTYSGSLGGAWGFSISGTDGSVTGTYTDTVNGPGTISGQMSTDMIVSSTYGFTGTAGAATWMGTLNVSTGVFSGTWTMGAGSSGSFTGNVTTVAPTAPAPAASAPSNTASAPSNTASAPVNNNPHSCVGTTTGAVTATLTGSTATVSWPAVPSAVSYNVTATQTDGASTSAFTLPGQNSGAKTLSVTATTHDVVLPTLAGMKYKFIVTPYKDAATNLCGYTTNNAAVTVGTLPATTKTAVTMPTGFSGFGGDPTTTFTSGTNAVIFSSNGQNQNGLFYSADGSTWNKSATTVFTTSSIGITKLAASPSTFLAVMGGYSYGQQTPFDAYTSVDGANWVKAGSFTAALATTVSANAQTYSILGVQYFNAVFYATVQAQEVVNNVVTNRNISYSSTDNGATWSATTSNLGLPSTYAVGSVFVRNMAATRVFERSNDGGVTWATIALNANANLTGVSGNNLLGSSSTHFVAWQYEIDAANQMQTVFYTSTDGSNWTPTAQDYVSQSVLTKCLQMPTGYAFPNWQRGKADGNRFYVAGDSCLASTDGATWKWEFYDAVNAAAPSNSGYTFMGLGLVGTPVKPFYMTYPRGSGYRGATSLSTIP